MRLSKRLCAILISLALLFSLSGCDLMGIFYPNYDLSRLEEAFSGSYASHEDAVPFEEMEYARPDVGKIADCADNIRGMLDGGSPRSDVISALKDFYGLYYDFLTMEALACIRSDLDTSDEYYLEEYGYCATEYAEISRIADDLFADCASSSISEYLDSQFFGGMLAEDYTSDGGYQQTDKYVALKTRENELISDYRDILIEMSLRSDYDVYAEYGPDVCELYIELVKTRNDIAAEFGFDSYEEYCYNGYGRDYTPDDLRGYTAAIHDYIIPLYIKAAEAGMFDYMYELDPLGSDYALEILKGCVSGMGSEISEAMDFMLNYGLYDISDAEEKLDSSYVVYLENYASPFLFSKTAGYGEDILSIAHEFGHFCDSYVNYDCNYNLDSSEMLSQGMEYMTLCAMDKGALKDALTRYKLLDALYLYINQSSFNEFEQRVYALSDNELTVDNICGIYSDIAEEYGYAEEYDEDILGYMWIDISHLFTQPFYVISYCVSDSAAFSLYNLELESAGAGMAAYGKLLDGADEYNFLELIDSEGMSSPISADTVKGIADTLAERLGI